MQEQSSILAVLTEPRLSFIYSFVQICNDCWDDETLNKCEVKLKKQQQEKNT